MHSLKFCAKTIFNAFIGSINSLQGLDTILPVQRKNLHNTHMVIQVVLEQASLI